MTPNSPPESKFAYVVLAARRARQLQNGARPLLDLPRSHKPTRIAMEELTKGLLEFELPESIAGFGIDDKDSKRRK
jgi:DNA-directed RNA polymerase subunit omega